MMPSWLLPRNSGLQIRPKKKSRIGYCPKKRIVSNSIEATMPNVVRMAMVEAPISRTTIELSTRLRARICGRIVPTE